MLQADCNFIEKHIYARLPRVFPEKPLRPLSQLDLAAGSCAAPVIQGRRSFASSP